MRIERALRKSVGAMEGTTRCGRVSEAAEWNGVGEVGMDFQFMSMGGGRRRKGKRDRFFLSFELALDEAWLWLWDREDGGASRRSWFEARGE